MCFICLLIRLIHDYLQLNKGRGREILLDRSHEVMLNKDQLHNFIGLYKGNAKICNLQFMIVGFNKHFVRYFL